MVVNLTYFLGLLKYVVILGVLIEAAAGPGILCSLQYFDQNYPSSTMLCQIT